MTYHTSWCPYCHYTLEVHNARYHPKIDSEFLPCPNCRNLYKTGKKLWNQMSDVEKMVYYVSEYCSGIFMAFILSVLLNTVLFGWLFKSTTLAWEIQLLLCFIIFLPLYIFLTYKAIKIETSTTFEDALLRHWKKYNSECDSLFTELNKFFITKYGLNFFELEKKTLPADLYNQNIYNQLDERIFCLYEILEKTEQKNNKEP